MHPGMSISSTFGPIPSRLCDDDPPRKDGTAQFHLRMFHSSRAPYVYRDDSWGYTV